jgi:DNA replication ATP-dependent helicase Dna2
VSLFRRLSDTHPHAVVDLAFQYRMNEDIMLLSNKLIYGDRLRCGSQIVANQTLKLPDPSFLHGLDDGWLRHLLNEEWAPGSLLQLNCLLMASQVQSSLCRYG